MVKIHNSKNRGRSSNFRILHAVVALTILLLTLSSLSLRLGSASISTPAFFRALLFRGEYAHSVILYQLRLPRILAAILGGIGLSVSGALLQTVTDNPLAAPNIIGVNAGAGLAVVISLAVSPALLVATALPAFLGAAAASALILAISRALGSSRTSLVLAGMALNAILNAAISLFTLLDTDLLTSYHAFSVGGLAGVGYEKLLFPAIMILTAAIFAFFLAPQLNPLALGDSVAISLGIRARRMRTVAVLLASASAAGVVSFAGLLGFVGLVVPNVARRLVGSSLRRLVPLSALLGANLLLAADLIGRILAAPSELPVGITMSAIGAPFFLWVLFSRRKKGGV